MISFKLLACVFIILGFVTPLILYINAAPSPDEAYYVIVAGDFSQGHGIPYKDFASDPKPPGIYYTLASLFYVTGPSLPIGRIFVYIVNIITAIFVYKIAEIYKKGSGYIASILYLFAILLISYEGFLLITEPFMVLFISASVYFLLNSHGSKYKILFSGIFGGISFLIKQPGGILIVFFVSYFVFEMMNRKFGFCGMLRNVGMCIAGFFIPVTMSFAHFYFLGELPDLINWVFLVPSGFKPSLGVFSVAGAFHIASFGIVFLLAIFAVYDIIIKKHAFQDSKIISLLSFGVFSVIPWSAIQFGHYLLPVILVTCVFASLVINDYKIISKFSLKWFLVVFFLIGTVTVNLYSEINFQTNTLVRSHQLKEVSDFIKANTANDENIFVFGYDPAIYLLSDRRPPTSSYNVIPRLLGESEEIIKQRLEEKVSIVIKTTDCDKNINICNFISDRYFHETDFGGYEILKKR